MLLFRYSIGAALVMVALLMVLWSAMQRARSLAGVPVVQVPLRRTLFGIAAAFLCMRYYLAVQAMITVHSVQEASAHTMDPPDPCVQSVLEHFNHSMTVKLPPIRYTPDAQRGPLTYPAHKSKIDYEVCISRSLGTNLVVLRTSTSLEATDSMCVSTGK